MMTIERRQVLQGSAAAALIALLAMGCGDDARERETGLALEEEPAHDVMDASLGEAGDADAGASSGDGSSGTVDAGSRGDPRGSYFADFTANGTGCPAGTWDVQFSPDGQRMTATFSSFEAEVDPTRAVSIKNCMLAIKLHSPQGLSYSVQDFYYSGYAFLEEGVDARLVSQYYFQGNPAQDQQPETTFVGPKDDTYLIQDSRKQIEAQPVWSPCGVDRNLNINTVVRLKNTNNPRRNGYVNVSSVDGSTKLVLKLAWRRCSQ